MSDCNSFLFSPTDRQALGKILSRFDEERVFYFLVECERVISEWRLCWPVVESLEKASHKELQKVASQCFDLAQNIHYMTKGTSEIFWNSWRFRQNQRPFSFNNCSELWQALWEVGDSAKAMADAMCQKGGARKVCEAEYIEVIANTYRKAFKRRPSATMNGTFGMVILNMAQCVELPGGGEMQLGRDLIRTTIKKRQTFWDYEDELVAQSRTEYGI